MEERLLEASFAELMLETLGFEEMANGSIIDNSTGNLNDIIIQLEKPESQVQYTEQEVNVRNYIYCK
mgnify:CR=1 FL=1